MSPLLHVMRYFRTNNLYSHKTCNYCILLTKSTYITFNTIQSKNVMINKLGTNRIAKVCDIDGFSEDKFSAVATDP